ncbi:hypothetical protein OPV22_032967 [Ensete ventricosum]|uniref:Tetratricopeptide SHNi-TPR domain-containing protein n=1 Tax=Ensete ventricosum TaxID=4639 RepID=A0AAV8P2V4_ENSVE|nr:hypothetical protein OPV22_032967 [Ensete ventricosum]
MASPGQTHSVEEALAQDPVPSEANEAMAPEEAAGVKDLDRGGGSSSAPNDEGPEKTLFHADELFEKGSKAIEDGDFVEAVDCLSRALEIKVSHFGELSQECASSYYKYGCALLYKAQEEAEPLGNFPKGSLTSVEKAKTSSCTEESGSSSMTSVDNCKETPVGKEVPDGESLEDEDYTNDEVDDGSGDDDDEDTAEADEDESDLDLAWKMLDVARAIVEKSTGNTMEKVNILAALAEVSMEREDIETSLNDYLRALSILEHLVEVDNRRIVELNFRISLVLELGSRIKDAIPYCERAISLCKSRLQRLEENTTSLTTPAEAVGSSLSGSEKSDNLTAEDARSSSNFVEEIELFSSILTELEKKLEDLQQILMNPRSVVSEVMKLIASQHPYDEKNAPSASRASSLNSSQMGTTNGGFDSPTISTAASNGGVMDLGVVGRGIKRATVKPIDAEPCQKKPKLDKPTES